MRNYAFPALAAGLFGGAMLLSGLAPASAATLPSAGFAAPGETAVVEQVAKRDRDRERSVRWDRSRHGPRYSYARPGYSHFHGGYYYSMPWWIGPSISLGLSVPSYGYGYGYGNGYGYGAGQGYGGGHVEWCLNRYRSYDPASDTYMGYDGYRHRCNSPF